MGKKVKLTRLANYSNFDFQRLEFLGDAVIEVYTLVTAKRLLDYHQIKHKPEDLHNFKALLLSCFGLTLFGISLEIVQAFEPGNKEILSQLDQLSKELKLFESKKLFC